MSATAADSVVGASFFPSFTGTTTFVESVYFPDVAVVTVESFPESSAMPSFGSGCFSTVAVAGSTCGKFLRIRF